MLIGKITINNNTINKDIINNSPQKTRNVEVIFKWKDSDPGFRSQGHACNFIFLSHQSAVIIAPSNKIADLTSPIITVRDKYSPCVPKVSLNEAPLIMSDYSESAYAREKEARGSGESCVNRAFNCATRA